MFQSISIPNRVQYDREFLANTELFFSLQKPLQKGPFMKWSKMGKMGRREECSVIIGFTDFFDKFKNLQKMKKVFAKKRSFL